jgi:hypothetical protein
MIAHLPTLRPSSITGGLGALGTQRGLPGGWPPARVQGAAPAEPVDKGSGSPTRVQGAAPAEPVDKGSGSPTRVQGAAPAEPVNEHKGE